MAERKCKLGVPGSTAPEPGGGIAKTLATVLAPGPGSRLPLLRFQRLLAPLRAPAKFSARALRQLGRDEFFEAVPHRVAEPQPDEMGQLVDKDAGEFGVRAVERDTPFAQEGSGVYRPATPA